MVTGRFEAAVRRRFWFDELGLFVDNLPWIVEGKYYHCSDRTLAMSILFGMLDESQLQRAADLLVGKAQRR